MFTLKRLSHYISTHRMLLMSAGVLGLSALFCFWGLFILDVGHSSSYLLTASYFRIYDFTYRVFSTLLYIGVVIWAGLWVFLLIATRTYWRIVFLCWVLTPPICFIGIIFGALVNQFKPVYSTAYHERSYHLVYIYDGSDQRGYYDLQQCDSIGLSCASIFSTYPTYPQIDTNAQVTIDEATTELAVIVEGNVIYTHNLSP